MTSPSKTFYFAGQWSFGNRGCEALIRSNTQLIRERFPDAHLLCPSHDIALDQAQWPLAAECGVEFVPAGTVPIVLKIWNKLYRWLPGLRKLGVLPLTLDAETRRQIGRADAVLMTGGDIISLDYELLSLRYWTGVIDAARRMGKPTHLVAASVGPFTKDPATERQMVKHLQGYASITVRETASLQYLKSLGLQSVVLVADPAFVMEPEAWEGGRADVGGRSRLGLNVSPVVRGFRADDASRVCFDEDIKAFIRCTIDAADGYDVLLVPHVDPLQGGGENSDRAYMQRLLAEMGDTGGRVTLLRDGLNAAQLKYALGGCRYFIGARTHATIAAISQSVPTLSIAYSVKAVGINRDLFGSEEYVLPTSSVSFETLLYGLRELVANESHTKAILSERLPLWRERARLIPASFDN